MTELGIIGPVGKGPAAARRGGSDVFVRLRGDVPQSLGRLAVGAQKRPAHPFLIAETGFGGDDLDRMPALLDHELRAVEPERFDRFGG
jgi:hypothetical protein